MGWESEEKREEKRRERGEREMGFAETTQ